MQKNSPKWRVVWGSAWAIAARWAIRISGFVSTIVIARLLTPADYGVVSIAAMTAGSVELLSQTGQDAAIIRHPNPTREHFDTVWTIQFLLGLLLAAGILATIPLTYIYFNEPRAAAVVAVFGLRTAILGAMNTGALHFRRDFQFINQFLLSAYPTAISCIVSIVAAFVLRNYWALVVGLMSRSVASVACSYLMHPFRPRFDFSKMGEIWSFSIWSLARAVGATLDFQADKYAVGGFGGAAGVGLYEVARDLATNPSQELIGPITTVLLPVMAQEQHDRQRLREVYLDVLYMFALICTSTGVGVTLVAHDLAALVLGPQWTAVDNLIPWFALSWCLIGIVWSTYSTFDALGKPMTAARLQWMRVVVLALTVAPVAYFVHDIEAVAIATFIVSLVVAPMPFFALARELEMPLTAIALTLQRPILGSLLMSAVVISFNTASHVSGPLRLFLDVVLGAFSYTGCLMIFWYLRGRPAGPEADAYHILQRAKACVRQLFTKERLSA